MQYFTQQQERDFVGLRIESPFQKGSLISMLTDSSVKGFHKPFEEQGHGESSVKQKSLLLGKEDWIECVEV